MVESAREPGCRPTRGSSSTPSGWLRSAVIALAVLSATAAADPVRGDSAATRRAAHAELLRRNASAPVLTKLDVVNRFFNALHQRADRDTWGREDHWSTPEELLALGAGDCEDLAIGKYFALRRLGIPASALRITYTRDVARNRPHMVLVHRDRDARLRVLDSRSDALSSVAERRDLVPIYEFNEQHVTLIAPDGARHSFSHTGRRQIHQWAGLLRRAAARTTGRPVAQASRLALTTR